MMTRFVAILSGMLLLSVVSVQAADIQAGQSLHELHCTSCHASLMGGDPNRIYTRAERRISAYDSLAAQVRRCATSLETPLSESDLENITAFLNVSYYRF